VALVRMAGGMDKPQTAKVWRGPLGLWGVLDTPCLPLDAEKRLSACSHLCISCAVSDSSPVYLAVPWQELEL
jgi:hypothetical protein